MQFRYLLNMRKPTETFPVLLLLEARCCQARGRDITLTKVDFVTMTWSLHSTHILQPLGERLTGYTEPYFSDKN
jgi:hypothetical protein